VPSPSTGAGLAPSSLASPPDAEQAATRVRSPVAPFVIPAPSIEAGAWTGLRWRRLAPDDPLGLVATVVSSRGGAVAIGWVDSPTGPMTPVWTSRDLVHWEPLPFGTATTFWPDALVLGLVEHDGDFVAITEQAGASCPVCAPLVPPVVAWTSTDGRAWTPHTLPPGGVPGPAGTAPLVAVGPAGILLASTGTGHRLALSPDGATWRLEPADALPVGFALQAITGTSSGYVAAGRLATPAGGRAAVFTSRDGRSWSVAVPFPTPRDLAASVGTALDAILGGTDGLVLVGHTVSSPGATLWWRSTDGLDWTPVPDFAPLVGPTALGGGPMHPAGWLVDDGRRLLAIRGGPAGAAWLSLDGAHWTHLVMSGDLPAARAAGAVLLPDGVLLSDGATCWYGEAVVR
ncbi:MAG TPA: hypothetical protein VEY67_06295, partial [Candidatus Dormibacteraeota bacterium]|nr:hypothetical protein [Candidatus Dormibacteraeota bacterium]